MARGDVVPVPTPGQTVASFLTRSLDPRPAFPIGTRPDNYCTDGFPRIRIRIRPLNGFPESEFRCKLRKLPSFVSVIFSIAV